MQIFHIVHSINPSISKIDDDIHARIGEMNNHSIHLFGLINIKIRNHTRDAVNKHIAECVEMKSATLSVTPKPVLLDGW